MIKAYAIISAFLFWSAVALCSDRSVAAMQTDETMASRSTNDMLAQGMVMSPDGSIVTNARSMQIDLPLGMPSAVDLKTWEGMPGPRIDILAVLSTATPKSQAAMAERGSTQRRQPAIATLASFHRAQLSQTMPQPADHLDDVLHAEQSQGSCGADLADRAPGPTGCGGGSGALWRVFTDARMQAFR